VLEALTTLAVAAGAGTRCTLGTAVLQLALRDPAVVAKSAASLQELSGGRLVLGVGAGAHEGEFAATGADFARRGAALDAALDELARLWAPGDERYAQRPAPSPVPIWVGGSGDPALRRAARRGDGWIPMFLSPDALRSRYRQLDAEIVLAGRQPAEVARSVLVFVHTGPDGAAARHRGLTWMSSLYGLPAARLDRHLVAGEPAECADRLAAYADAGAQHLCVFVADDDPLPHLDAVLGHLRAATRSAAADDRPTIAVTAPRTATPASTARTVHP
jgi:alkanesulfonate monooxygenase